MAVGSTQTSHRFNKLASVDYSRYPHASESSSVFVRSHLSMRGIPVRTHSWFGGSRRDAHSLEHAHAM